MRVSWTGWFRTCADYRCLGAIVFITLRRPSVLMVWRRFSRSWNCQPRIGERTEAASDEIQAEQSGHCASGSEKSNQARRRVIESINELQSTGAAINFNTICTTAHVSKTFLYDPKHSDLAQQIRSLRQVTPQSTATEPTTSNKSDSAKVAQIARFKERIQLLEKQVRGLQEENEVLYGKLSADMSSKASS